MTSDKPDTSKDLYRKALNTALRILTRRDHSKYELAQKLKQRDFKQEVIEKVMSECERFDYINDERTALVFIRQLKRKCYGKKHVRYELIKKGLKGKHIQGIISENVSEADERQCAQKVIQKHLNRFKREKDILKRKNKIYRFLYSRGFSKGVISELVKKYDNITD